MQIVVLPQDNHEIQERVAALLVEGFKEHWPNAWPDIESALGEVKESFGEDRISRVALDKNGSALGWIGGIREYDGHAWELHPLAVHPDHQGRGIGRALVKDFERLVHLRGGTTMYLGTDDEDQMTSLSDKDLYPNIFKHLTNIKNLQGHPFEFYQKMGFIIVGVIPDANGPGKPDITMAKRVSSQ